MINRLLGSLEESVLSVLADREQHATSDIVHKMRSSGYDVSAQGVSVTLNRLKQRGYISSQKNKTSGMWIKGIHIFRITEGGLKPFTEQQEFKLRLWNMYPDK